MFPSTSTGTKSKTSNLSQSIARVPPIIAATPASIFRALSGLRGKMLLLLSSLQDFGGINQKQAVVSLYSLKDYNLTRANNSEIRIFQERDLLNLSQLISEWLQPKSINISQGISL